MNMNNFECDEKKTVTLFVQMGVFLGEIECGESSLLEGNPPLLINWG